MSKLYLTISIFFFAVQFGQTQSTDLFIQKTGPTQCYVGESITYTIVIENLGNSAADGATFNDNFPANVSNVTLTSCTAANGAACPGSYTLNNSNFSGTIPTLPVGGTVTFVLTMRSPVPFSGGSFSNTATCSPPSGTTELDPNTNSSTWNTTQLSDADLTVESSVNHTTPFNCDSAARSYTYTIRWINDGPSAVSNIYLINDILLENITSSGSGTFNPTYQWTISNMQWSSTGSTSLPTQQFSPMTDTKNIWNLSPMASLPTSFGNQVSYFGAGDTITLTYTFTFSLSSFGSGCGNNAYSWTFRNYASIIGASSYVELNNSDNSATLNIGGNACSAGVGNACPTADLQVESTVNHTTPFNCDSSARSFTYTIRWINNGPSNLSNVYLINDILLENITSSGSGTFNPTYQWTISNMQWSSTGSTSLPTQQFSPMTDTKNIWNLSPMTSLPTSFGNQVSYFGAGDTITLTYTFTFSLSSVGSGCGNNAYSWTFRNYASISGASYDELNTVNNSATLNIGGNACSAGAGNACPTADLQVESTVNHNNSFNCSSSSQSYTYTIRWINNGPSNLNNIYLFNDILLMDITNSGSGTFDPIYQWSISNIQWSSTGATSLPTQQFSPMTDTKNIWNLSPMTSLPTSFGNQVSYFGAADTITLTYTFTFSLFSVGTGCGNTYSWTFRNYSSVSGSVLSYYEELNNTNNSTTLNIGGNTLSATDLAISKSLTPSIVNTGDTIQFSVEFQNTSSGVTNPAVWVDTIPEGVEIDINSISCTAIVGSPPCGTIIYDPVARTLTQTIANMPSNSGVRVTYNLLVTEQYSKTIPSQAYAIHPCVDCNLSSNYAQTNFAIVGRCDYKYAGTDGFTEVCQSNNALNLIDYLFAPGKIDPGIGGEWNRTSGSGGVFDAPSGTFVPAKGATNSDFTYIFAADAGCLADTSYVRVSILPCVLPVDLLYFEAFSTDKQTVTLQWATASETNTDYFTIERSQNAIDWHSVTNVKAAGNSATATYYETIDPTPLGGLSYYRLKQIDTDGTFSYGFIKAVTRNENSAVVVFPNPASDKINILTDVSPFGVEIINIYGQTVLASDNKNELSLSELSNGTYVIKVMAPGGAIHIEKLIIR